MRTSRSATVPVSFISLPMSQSLHVELAFTSADQTLRTRIFQAGTLLATIPDAVLGEGFQGFVVDQVAVESYDGTDSGGSLLAHGTVSNLSFTATPAPLGEVAGALDGTGGWQAAFRSRVHWTYSLQRTADFASWMTVGSPAEGTGGALTLRDPAPAAASGFYRVVALEH